MSAIIFGHNNGIIITFFDDKDIPVPATTSLHFSSEDLADLDLHNIPNHIAIIMDGNRRWAKKNLFNLTKGHSQGTDTLMTVTEAAIDLQVKTITAYAFSTENWDRPSVEVKALLKLLERSILRFLPSMEKNGVRFHTIGDITRFPQSCQDVLQKAKEETAKNTTIDLVVALNYGGRDEIRRAFSSILMDYDEGKISSDGITEDLIASHLDTAAFSDPELLIRTSGEYRLSNFMLWQLSYSEMYIVDTLWPEFTPSHLLEAIIAYQTRDRRLGRS
jgi:undecaprenyl diphosphate synthase